MDSWYKYLTPEFKLDQDAYTVNDKAVFDCPKCHTTSVVRINHAKKKIKKLGYYECSRCRKQTSIIRARESFSNKYGNTNPFQLDFVKEKIKHTNLKLYGVECLLSIPEVRTGKSVKTQIPSHHHKINPEDVTNYNEKNRRRMNNYHNKYAKEKSVNDLRYRLARRLRSRLATAIKHQFKGGSAVSNLGCSLEELSSHLEKQFLPGMTWDNWGIKGWHIDHIIPLSKFDLGNPDEFKIAAHYTNLQPKWFRDNFSKNARLPQVYILTGCFGSGKTTIQNSLHQEFVNLSDDQFHNEYDAAKANKAVLFHASINVVNTIGTFRKYFDVKVVVIDEDFNVILERLKARSTRIKKEINIKARIERMKSIARLHGDFSGTADECLDYLKNQIKLIG